MVKEEATVLVVLFRWHYRAAGAAVRRSVGDEVLGSVEEEVGSATVRRVPPGLLDVPVHVLGALGIVVEVDAAHLGISANAPITKTNTRPPLYLLSTVAIILVVGPSEPNEWALSLPVLAARLRQSRATPARRAAASSCDNRRGGRPASAQAHPTAPASPRSRG